MLEAVKTYAEDPVALQLCSMNMFYEMTFEGKNTVIFVSTETYLVMPLGVYGLIDKFSQVKKSEQK